MSLVGLDPPLWMQNAAYAAGVDRDLIDAVWSAAGVIGVNDLVVAQRGAGANMSVDVAAGRAIVAGSDATGQGKYLCRATATNNLPIAAAPGPGTSRIDRVVAHVYDDAVIGGSIHAWQLEVVQGTAAASPVAPNMPTSALELAQVTVPNGLAAVVAGNITDRRALAAGAGRPWDSAWGELGTQPGTANAVAGGAGWVAVPGAAVTVTLPAGRRIRIDGIAYMNGDAVGQFGGLAAMFNGAAQNAYQSVWYCSATGTAGRSTATAFAVVTSIAGANTFAIAVNRQGSLGTNITAIAPHVGTGITVTDIGPASPTLRPGDDVLGDILEQLPQPKESNA